MSTATRQSEAEDALRPGTYALDRIVAMAGEQRSPKQTVRAATSIIADQFGSPLTLVSVQIAGREHTEAVEGAAPASSTWRRVLDDMVLDVRSAPRAIGRLYPTSSGGVVGVIAAPISDGAGSSIGAVALVTACQAREQLTARMAELRAACSAVSAVVASCAIRSVSRGDDGARVAQTIGRANAYSSLTELAFALTNNLRNKLECDQVVMGVTRGPRVRIAAISGLDDIKPRSPGTAAVRAALEEALDEGQAICVQGEQGWGEASASTEHRLHRAWRECAGGAAVASIPLVADGSVTAVIGIRRRGDRPFTADELTKIEELVQPFGVAIPIVERATRTLASHAVTRVRDIAGGMLSPKGWGRRIAAVGLTALAAWVYFGTVTYNVSVDAVLAPQELRQIAAPFTGTLAEVHVQPGQRVQKGDVLCAFDTRELELQAAEVRAEIVSQEIEIDRSMADSAVAAASLASARREASVARLRVLEYRIDNAVLRAPADGLVLAGDLRPRVGQLMPMGEPLVSFAPSGSLRVELRTPQSEIDELALGQSGAFAPTARPGARQAFEITSVHATSEILDGKNVYIAEGTVDSSTDWMRPGMEGVARIDAGKRPVWWVAFHRVSDFIRMRLWL